MRNALWSSLQRVNPVAKLIGTAPAMIALFVTRGVFVPSVFIIATLLTLLVFGAIGLRRAAVIVASVLVLGVVGATLLGLWVEPAGSTTWWEAGPLHLSETGVRTGAATTLRMLAIITLMLLSGLTTPTDELLLSLQQQLRIPYRYVHAARTALVIAPFMAENLRTIKLAHTVRGTVAARGPAGWLARQFSYAVPLMAGGIRRGERLALAMDSRAFGQSPRRTERRVLRWRAGDTYFIAACLLFTVCLYLYAGRMGLLGELRLW